MWRASYSVSSTSALPNIFFSFKAFQLHHGYHWHTPADVLHLIPNWSLLVSQVIILTPTQEDLLIWKRSTSGEISLKEAYDFKKHNYPMVQWAKTIWSKDSIHFKVSACLDINVR